MRFIISLILIAALSYVLCLFLPWWSIAIAAFVVCAFIPQRGFASFITAFIALFLLWGYLSWMIDADNHEILSHRISVLVFKNDNPLLLILLTSLTGAIVAGFAALAGSFVHKKLK